MLSMTATVSFDLDHLDQDLTCMSLIRALPPNMENLAQQLLLKDALTKEIIINAFVQHDITTSAGFKAPEAAFHTSGTSLKRGRGVRAVNPKIRCLMGYILIGSVGCEVRGVGTSRELLVR